MADIAKSKRKLILPTVFSPMVEQQIAYTSKEYAYKLASILAGRLRGAILTQAYDWAPLSEAWLAKKEKMGWDLRILRATGDYVNSIVPRRHRNLDNTVDDFTYVVQPSPDHVTHSGKTLKQIGFYLEYGTLNRDGTIRMPARPHWRPVWKKFKSEQETIKREIQSAVVKRLGDVLRGVTRRV